MASRWLFRTRSNTNIFLTYVQPTKSFKHFHIKTGDGTECNTRYLREKLGWQGLMIDGYWPDNLEINRRKENILYSNIVKLFEKYKVNINLDLLSVDTDYADYWILEGILICFSFNKSHSLFTFRFF